MWRHVTLVPEERRVSVAAMDEVDASSPCSACSLKIGDNYGEAVSVERKTFSLNGVARWTKRRSVRMTLTAASVGCVLVCAAFIIRSARGRPAVEPFRLPTAKEVDVPESMAWESKGFAQGPPPPKRPALPVIEGIVEDASHVSGKGSSGSVAGHPAPPPRVGPRLYSDLGFQAGYRDEKGWLLMEDTAWYWEAVGGGISRQCSAGERRRLRDADVGSMDPPDEGDSEDDRGVEIFKNGAYGGFMGDGVTGDVAARRLADKEGSAQKKESDPYEGVYYHVAHAENVSECQQKCGIMQTCYGISFATELNIQDYRRCELWLVPIHSITTKFGYMCLRARLKSTRFSGVDGGVGRHCVASDNPGLQPRLFGNRMTLADCKRVCANYIRCNGIDWREEADSPGPTYPLAPAGPCRAFPRPPSHTVKATSPTSLCLKYNRLKPGQFSGWQTPQDMHAQFV